MLIKSEILITMRMGWPVSSDKWKAPWVDWETRKLTLFPIRQLFSLNETGPYKGRPRGVRKLLRHCSGKTRHVNRTLNFVQESRNGVVIRSGGADRVCRLSVSLSVKQSTEF